MSDWRKKQGPASFRGVPFFVDSSERAGGRQAVVHEYPFSENPPFTEDLGAAGRKFSADGYVLGDEYTTARDNLLAALEQPGPGELVHPAYGSRRAVVLSYRVREGRDLGGIARFSIEFAETIVKPLNPGVTQDAGFVLSESAASARTTVGDRFMRAYTSASLLRASVAGALRSVGSTVGRALDRLDMAAQSAASLRRQIKDLSAQASSLAAAPGSLLSSVGGLLAELQRATVTDPIGVLLGVAAFDPGETPPQTTPSRLVEFANFVAVQQLVQRLAVIGAAEAAGGVLFPSFDDAVAARDRITTALDDVLEEIDDSVFVALSQLRTDLVSAVPGPDSDLPRIQRYVQLASTPSLVLAHNLYGDVSRELEIIARNKISNPGLIGGGVALEVLTRG